jgi:hypothetical protein
VRLIALGLNNRGFDMNKKQKIIFPVIIVGFLVLFFIGYYYLVGFNNWAGATPYSFSFFSILNKIIFFVFVFFLIWFLLKRCKVKYFTDKMQDLYVILFCITFTLLIPLIIMPSAFDTPFNFGSFKHFLMQYSLIAFVFLYGVASACIKIFKL